ncbi:MAG: hypothetical protein B0D91_03825 [Oceanospirillales bacterium LUC14_002_19_P2]|nr:MAG: hypothetical protein B0D91_03825 [Oceanospirillales bacterium LUC14_002_19_P2]
MDPLQQALEALKPNHHPDPVTWWPPAPGWWLAALIVLAGVGVSAFLLYRHYARNRYRRAALQETQRIAKALKNSEDSHALISDLNQLLKRVALSAWPRDTVAALHGNEWLNFLDKTSRSNDFTTGPGQVFGDERFAPGEHTLNQTETDQLQRLVERWIRKHHV